jgi:RHS repeat-associated protein
MVAETSFQSTGLQYLRARYYDPSTGRFLSRDPLVGQLGLPQTQNRYPYVMGNPVSRLDPLGLCGFMDPTDCVSDVVNPVVNTVTQTVDKAVDQIHITPQGVFLGTVLLYAGGGLIMGGALICSDIILSLGTPISLLTAPHELAICSGMVGFGGIIYFCGVSIILTSWCGVSLPAKTAATSDSMAPPLTRSPGAHRRLGKE